MGWDVVCSKEDKVQVGVGGKLEVMVICLIPVS